MSKTFTAFFVLFNSGKQRREKDNIMAITKNIINSILDSMNYHSFDAIEIVKDENAENVVVITFMNSSNIIEHVYYVDTIMNYIMFTIDRDEYHETFNDEHDNARFYEIYLNKFYLDDARLIHFFDTWLKSYTNNYQSIDDKTHCTNNYYFTNIIQALWHNAEYIYNDDFSHNLNFTFICDYMDDCHIDMYIVDSDDIDYNI